MSHHPKDPCPSCGQPKSVTASLCMPCRIASRPKRPTCLGCGKTIGWNSTYCRSCIDKRRTEKAETEQDVRFWGCVNKTDICWLWTGTKHSAGYGQFRTIKKTWYAHRYSYELTNGPVPDGLVIDHICNNRLCVNPAHLRAVTQQENILRGTGASTQNIRVTHCPHGHEYTQENTYYRPRTYGRVCRACARIKRGYKGLRKRRIKHNPPNPDTARLLARLEADKADPPSDEHPGPPPR